ncbi:hypothetical protein AB0M46_45630 [Dactylosporangium sp. NPDC051485]|uniref:hypothetical protein n=1 Tax=Dactylosporangium sp. NPDC051485 TaxID=3154846 RepID=UPI003441C71F
MHRLETTQAVADDLIQQLARHAPPGVDLGRPIAFIHRHLIFEQDGLVGVLSATEHGLHRYAAHPDGTVTVTGWLLQQRIYHHEVAAVPDWAREEAPCD